MCKCVRVPERAGYFSLALEVNRKRKRSFLSPQDIREQWTRRKFPTVLAGRCLKSERLDLDTENRWLNRITSVTNKLAWLKSVEFTFAADGQDFHKTRFLFVPGEKLVMTAEHVCVSVSATPPCF